MREARFATAPIGAGLAVNDGGLTLTTTADGLDLGRTARSDVGHASGTHGVEFVVLNADAALAAAVGVVKSTAVLTTRVGIQAGSVGWRLDTGQVLSANTLVASGLPIPQHGQVVGVRARIDADVVDFYLEGTLVHSQALPGAAATWHFAASLGSPATPAEGDTPYLTLVVNAGQWQAVSAAAAAGWRAAEAAVDVLRLADRDWLSAPDDAPANARWEGVIDQAGVQTIAELDFWAWGGNPSGGGAAQLTVLDADGLLDTLALSDANGVAVAIQSTVTTLADATAVMRGVLTRIEVRDDLHKTLVIGDAHEDLDLPLSRAVFLPNIPALAWQPIPVVIGAVASVPALLANGDGTVAFLADAPLAHVDVVLDRGDAHDAADWSLDPSNQQLLLVSPPIGPVVVDASSIGPGMVPATLEEALTEIFRRIEKAAWNSADAAAIDTATGYAGIGYYNGDGAPVLSAVRDVLRSYGAGWWQDGDGVLRFGRVVDPDTAASTFALDTSDLGEDVQVWPDEAPNLTRRMAYRPNARPLSAGELVTDLEDVPLWRRRELVAPYRGIAYAAGPLAARYRHADQALPIVSGFWQQQDAQAEIDRVVALYAVERRFYRWTVIGNTTLDLQPGQVGTITYGRYGLEAGRQVLVRRVQRNPVTGRVELTFWGA